MLREVKLYIMDPRVVVKEEVIDVLSVSPVKASTKVMEYKTSQPLDLSQPTVGSATRLLQAIAAKHPPISKIKEEPTEIEPTTPNQTSNYQPPTSLPTTTATYQVYVPPHQSAAATATNQLPTVTTSGPVKPALVPPAYFAAAAHMSTPGLPPVKDMARQNHLLLQQELISMQQHQHLTAATKRLQQEYITAINQIETNRYQTLIYNIGNDLCKQMTNSYYDHEWMMLIQKTRHQAATMCFSTTATVNQEVPKQATMAPAIQPTVPASRPAFMQQTSISQPQLQSVSKPAPQPAPSSRPTFMQQPTLYQAHNSIQYSTPLRPSQEQNTSGTSSESPQLTSDTSSNSSQNNSPDSTGDSTTSPTGSNSPDGKRKYLSTRATMVLSDWYCQHFDHPYPSDQDLQHLAKAADITLTQVKKWMANKRVRSYNTLAFNGSVHPKKLKRLQREHMARLRVGLAPESVAPVQTPTSEVTASPADTKQNRKPNTPLNPQAQQILNQWYEEHLTNPYPSDDEKALLAQQGGITIKQVKYWFANKRSRSGHTRRDNYINMRLPQPVYSPITTPVPGAHHLPHMQGLYA